MGDAQKNLIPWKPGQSGNPRGHSAGRRKSKRLREALDLMLEQEIPDSLFEKLDPKLAEALPDGVTFSEVIALRVAMLASTASRPGDILSAASLIIGAQAAPDNLAPPPKVEPPRLPPTEERRRAVAQQLGLEDDDETTVH